MFKIFPAWITPEGSKVPLVKGWQTVATTDPKQIELWNQLYGNRIQIWGIPCGPETGILVLDADVKDNGLETLKSLHVPLTLSQRTRSGGMHFFFKYPTNDDRYRNRNRFMPGLDIRGAGGWVAYYNFTDPNTPIADAPAWLLQAAAERVTQENAPPPQGSVIRVAPEIAERIIKVSLDKIREAPEGESNNILNIESFRVGQLVTSQSITREYAERVLFEAAKARGKPDYEARATIASGLNGGNAKPLLSPFPDSAPVAVIDIPPPPVPQRWTPDKMTYQDLINTQALRKPQLFKDWSTEDITITTADGGTGKTTLKLYEAVCLALGHPFLGFQNVQQGRTLYITGEDTDKKLAAMIGQILKQMGILDGFNPQVNQVLESIKIKKDADLCLISKDRQGFITPNPVAMRSILEAIDDFKPKFVVFDPISSFWGSESALNDMNKAVTKFMSEIAERGICVEMINHMGKSSSAQKDVSQFAGRGGTGLPSNSRVSRVLHGIGADEYKKLTGEDLPEGKSAMTCYVNKFSDFSPLLNKPFIIVRDGHLFGRKNLSPEKERQVEQEQSDLERVLGYVKDERAAGRYPTEPVVYAHFMHNGNAISKERIKGALNILKYQGFSGDKLKLIDNPDQVSTDKHVLIVTDLDGRE